MTTTQTLPHFLKLLAHDVRWQLISALAQSDRRVQELMTIVGRPMNLVSYHLRQLRDGHLVQERRSSADARDVYYSLDMDQIAALYQETGQQLHPGLLLPRLQAANSASPIADGPIRVLFLCTHNSARSQMAEGLLRQLDNHGMVAFSAGTEPARVHPLAIQAMADMGIDIRGQSAKQLAAFQGQRFDYIITVCDRAREECPVFPGRPDQIHWSFPDPAAAEGDEEARLAVFRRTAQELNTRLRYFHAVARRNAAAPASLRAEDGNADP